MDEKQIIAETTARLLYGSAGRVCLGCSEPFLPRYAESRCDKCWPMMYLSHDIEISTELMKDFAVSAEVMKDVVDNLSRSIASVYGVNLGNK